MSSDETPSTAGFDAWKRAISDGFETAENRHVSIYVRSTLPPLGAKSRQERVIDSLDGMVERGLLDSVDLVVTGDRLCLCGTCTGTTGGGEVVDLVERLREWRGPAGASAAPFFERREVTSAIAGESATAIVPPRVAVSLSLDDSLAGVFPCRVGSEHYTVEDFLGVLGELERPELSPVGP